MSKKEWLLEFKYDGKTDFEIRCGGDSEVIFTMFGKRGGQHSLFYFFDWRQCERIGNWFLKLSKKLKAEDGE